jgi:hypothetical protein
VQILNRPAAVSFAKLFEPYSSSHWRKFLREGRSKKKQVRRPAETIELKAFEE